MILIRLKQVKMHTKDNLSQNCWQKCDREGQPHPIIWGNYEQCSKSFWIFKSVIPGHKVTSTKLPPKFDTQSQPWEAAPPSQPSPHHSPPHGTVCTVSVSYLVLHTPQRLDLECATALTVNDDVLVTKTFMNPRTASESYIR